MGPHPILTGAVALVALVAVAGLCAMPWLGSTSQRERRRRIASAVVGPYDEIWHPTGRQAVVVWQTAVEQADPLPAPGDPPSVTLGAKTHGRTRREAKGRS